MKNLYARIGVLVAVAGLAGVSIWLANDAMADGVPPSPGSLYYSGQLRRTDNNSVTSVQMAASLYATQTGGTPLCTVDPAATSITNGHFRLPLDPTGNRTCVDALHANATAFIQLTVDGQVLPRQQIGAVPYALEADHAVEASRAAGGSDLALGVVPSGAIMAFDLPDCPAGWTTFAPASNRVLVGASTTHARGSMWGAETVTISQDQMPAHTHNGVTLSGNPLSFDTPNDVFSFASPGIIAGHNGSTSMSYTNSRQYPGADHTHNFTTNPTGRGLPLTVSDPSLSVLYCRRM